MVRPHVEAAEPRPKIGTVERIQGEASATFENQKRPLALNDPIYQNDRLDTTDGARLKLRLADDTEITMGAKAALVVDRYVYDPDGAKGSILVNALAGTFLFKGGRLEQAKKVEARIITQVATLGIRGTTAWGGEIDGQYGVLVLDGEVAVTTKAGAVTLTSGLGTSIAGPNAAPGPARRWAPEKIARALATVEFKP